MRKVFYSFFMLVAMVCVFTVGMNSLAVKASEQSSEKMTVKVTNTKRCTLKIVSSKVAGATKYSYYYSTKKNGSYTLLESSESSSLKVTNKKLKQTQTYYIKVVAKGKGVKQSAIAKIAMKKKYIGSGKTVAIDAGHQYKANTGTEPNGPGSSVMKMKVTQGTQGCVTGLPEYRLTLQVAKKLKKELEARGYTVVMVRTTHQVNISNRERAEIANNSGADIFIRLHANGSDDSSVSGALSMSPSTGNAYLTSSVIKKSNKLATKVINEMCKTTGAKNRGVMLSDTMSGINWCTIPVTIVEMGFMTNPTEDKQMATTSYQKQLAQGIANGIDVYFGRR